MASSIKDLVNRSSTAGLPIGILTGNDRDTWANDHKKLVGKSIKEKRNKIIYLFSLERERSYFTIQKI